MNILKKYQIDNELTCTEMARRAGVHKGLMSRHLNCKRRISREMALVYKEVFGLKLDDLFAIEPEPGTRH